jgi:phosphoribosylformylglycinamidine synthase subunit PurQ / glutaminase
VAHGEGSFFADPATLDRLEDEGRVLFRYVAADGSCTTAANVNGSAHAIAGILSAERNVLGLMPHPENHVELALGSSDGRGLFASLLAQCGTSPAGSSRTAAGPG